MMSAAQSSELCALVYRDRKFLIERAPLWWRRLNERRKIMDWESALTKSGLVRTHVIGGDYGEGSIDIFDTPDGGCFVTAAIERRYVWGIAIPRLEDWPAFLGNHILPLARYYHQEQISQSLDQISERLGELVSARKRKRTSIKAKDRSGAAKEQQVVIVEDAATGHAASNEVVGEAKAPEQPDVTPQVDTTT